MHGTPPDPQQLEAFIGRVLDGQPLRRAPAKLEERVLQQLARRPARPWWLQGFSGWPVPARLLFVPLALGFVKLAFVASSRATQLWQSLQPSLQKSAPVVTAQSSLQLLHDLARAGQTVAGLVVQGIPDAWIYGAVALTLLLYAALFGLGAAAFRTLFITPASVRY
jgi:hypothetical protein